MGTLFGRAIACASSLLVCFSSQANDAVPGEFIIQLKQSRSLLSTNQIAEVLDAEVVEMLRKDLVLVRKDLSRNLSSTLNELNSNEFVSYAEPNYIYSINKTPNDPSFEKLWGLSNVGQKDSAGKLGVAGMDINAEKAWVTTTGSKNVVVAVIDTGVDFTHPDLSRNAWVNTAESQGKSGVDDDGNGFVDDIHGYDFANDSGKVIDDHGHGTHCAGTIGGDGNNAVGVTGVAWNVRIMGLKFMTKEGSGSLANAIKSIDYARAAGAHIMSNSWGGGSFSVALEKAIKDANDAGILFVAAAGNNTQNTDTRPSYPASYEVDNVVSVAAVDNRGNFGVFSNYGAKTVHVAAPGVNIYSTVPGGYKSMSGTSMAAPHVAGIAALLLSKDYCQTSKCKAYVPKDIRTRLIDTSRPLAALNGGVVSNGFVDAHAALTNTKPGPDQNDPSNWTSRLNTSISTAHPYSNSAVYSYEIDVPGAKQIALHFNSFETEAGYDLLKVYDAAGNELGSLSGGLSNRYSPVYATDKLKLVFQPDGTIVSHGFDIDHVKFQ